MSPHSAETLLRTSLVEVIDSVHGGSGEHMQVHSRTRLLFPYRGVFVVHAGAEEVVADASQVIFLNAGESCRTVHSSDGDASLVLTVDSALLREITPPDLLRDESLPNFRSVRLRIDPRAQVLVALLCHGLREGIAESLEAESLALTLVQRAVGPQTTHAAASTRGRQRLVDRAKLVLARDLARRWTLAEVAAEVGVSPVYLTQSFSQVEGVPLYRYQLRLRLARALDLLGDYEDLGTLSQDLGFASHSHFTTAFQQMYGRTPTEFRQAVLRR